MKRIFHHYENWEDYQAGMWRNVGGSERTEFLRKAIEFTGDAALYGSFMRRVLVEWPLACEHNLTDITQNRKAWIGHAATCIAIDCPEDITRLAWAQLSQQQQDDANEQARQTIEEWEALYEAKNLAIYRQMGEAGLPAGTTGFGRFSTRSYRQMSLLPEDLHRHPEK
jgi:hypothetical protein